jgi:predicted double-glycine peptidase
MTLKSILQRSITVALLAAAAGCRTPSDAQDPAPPLRTGGGAVRLRAASWLALRQQHVVMQDMDYSCGAAALASLLSYYFGDEAGETEIVRDILRHLTPEQVAQRQRDGLSLLDLKNCAVRRGYQAVGVRLSFDQLKSLPGPVLVHLTQQDYRHFSVLRGVTGSTAVLADPRRGNISMPSGLFRARWTGVALVLGKSDFGVPDDTPLAPPDRPSILYEHIPERHSRTARLR